MMKKRMSLALCALLLLAALAGCSAKSIESYVAESPQNADFEMLSEAESRTGFDVPSGSKSAGSGEELQRQSDAKMIYTANLQLETTEFDQADEGIAALVKQFDGYFEQRSLSNQSSQYRYASYVVRVPAARFESFCSQVGKIGKMVYSSDSAENITEEYYDTQSRLDTAKIKLERLQDLLRQATTMSDIIELESAISQTEYEIDYLSGTLRHYDGLVDYATVYIDLNEVYKLSETDNAPQTFGQRLGNAFRSGLSAAGAALEGFAVFLAYSWVALVVCAVIVIVVVRIVRGGKKKKAAAPAVPTAPENGQGE